MNEMTEPTFIWELTIPRKIEHKLWQALILIGIDINDELRACLSDYIMLEGEESFRRMHADLLLTMTDLESASLLHKLQELDAYDVHMWVVDEVYEEEL